MKFICPLVVVEDIARSRKFYEVVLGQRVKFDFGENVTFEGDFAIHLRSHFQQLIDGKPIQLGGNGYELYFEEDRVDEFAQKLKQHSVTFVHEVREQPWRQKVVRFYDPDGHIIEVGESMEYLSYRLHQEGMSVEAIAKATGLPKEFVKMGIAKFHSNN